MVAQAAWGIAGVQVLDDGSLALDDPNLDPRSPLTTAGIDGEPFVGLRAFLGAVAGRRAPIKLQLTGPVTLGIALLNLGVPAGRAFAVAGAAVRARARTLVAAAQETAPMAPLVVFLDEPGLTAAMQHGFPLEPNRTIDLVSSALATIEPHAVTGLHCCGLADWRVVLQAGPQILSLPLETGAVEHAGALGAFLERGGRVAWGAVPTAGPIGSTPERQWQHLSAEWCALTQAGCDPVMLREQALITPACGLGAAHRGAGRPRPHAGQPGRPPARDADARHAPHRRRLALRPAVTARRYDRRSCRPTAPSSRPGRSTTS